jgi:hypothetical protein
VRVVVVVVVFVVFVFSLWHFLMAENQHKGVGVGLIRSLTV